MEFGCGNDDLAERESLLPEISLILDVRRLDSVFAQKIDRCYSYLLGGAGGAPGAGLLTGEAVVSAGAAGLVVAAPVLTPS